MSPRRLTRSAALRPCDEEAALTAPRRCASVGFDGRCICAGGASEASRSWSRSAAARPDDATACGHCGHCARHAASIPGIHEAQPGGVEVMLPSSRNTVRCCLLRLYQLTYTAVLVASAVPVSARRSDTRGRSIRRMVVRCFRCRKHLADDQFSTTVCNYHPGA